MPAENVVLLQCFFVFFTIPLRVCVCVCCLTRPSFLLGQLGTFALLKLLTLLWGTLFIKMRSYLLEVLNKVLTDLCLHIPLLSILENKSFIAKIWLLIKTLPLVVINRTLVSNVNKIEFRSLRLLLKIKNKSNYTAENSHFVDIFFF